MVGVCIICFIKDFFGVVFKVGFRIVDVCCYGLLGYGLYEGCFVVGWYVFEVGDGGCFGGVWIVLFYCVCVGV